MTLTTEDVQPEMELMELPNNVIPAFFGEQIYRDVEMIIKQHGGPEKCKIILKDQGYHPSFVNAIVKKLISERGW